MLSGLDGVPNHRTTPYHHLWPQEGCRYLPLLGRPRAASAPAGTVVPAEAVSRGANPRIAHGVRTKIVISAAHTCIVRVCHAETTPGRIPSPTAIICSGVPSFIAVQIITWLCCRLHIAVADHGCHNPAAEVCSGDKCHHDECTCQIVRAVFHSVKSPSGADWSVCAAARPSSQFNSVIGRSAQTTCCASGDLPDPPLMALQG